MANDPTADKRLRNARRFELIYSLLTPLEKETALSGSDADLESILRSRGITDLSGTLIARRDWLSTRLQADTPKQDEPKKEPQSKPSGNIFGKPFIDWPTTPPLKPKEEKPEIEEEKKEELEIVSKPTPPTSASPVTTDSSVVNQSPETNNIPPEPTPPPTSSQLLPTKEASARQSPEEVGYYPDPEIVPEEFSSGVFTPRPVEPQPEPFTPSQSIPPQPSELKQSSRPRSAGFAPKKRGRITKKALGKTLKSQGKKAIARTLLSTIEIWGPVVGVILGIFLLVVIILALGCSVVSNPIGDFFGVNYCGNNPQQPTTPPPGPQEKPSSVTFVGGEAYLATADGCRINCPAGSKGDEVTIKIIIDVDTSKLDTNPANLKANVQISNRFFANIKTTGNPKTISVPVDTTYFVYQWSLPNTGDTKRHYEYLITGTLQTDTGATNAILTMSGVTLTSDGSTSGENGGLFEGATARPSNRTCNKYGGVMESIKKDFPQSSNTNYGDPLCTYSEAKLNKVIEETEVNTANQNMWKSIAKCESGSPNGYVANSVGGSWGKFQMRRSFPNPFKIWTQADDRGDVTWQKQVENAVSYNKSLARDGKNFSYWGTARCLCYYDKFKNTSSCKDIIRRGEVRTPNGGSCSSCTASEGKS